MEGLSEPAVWRGPSLALTVNAGLLVALRITGKDFAGWICGVTGLFVVSMTLATAYRMWRIAELADVLLEELNNPDSRCTGGRPPPRRMTRQLVLVPAGQGEPNKEHEQNSSGRPNEPSRKHESDSSDKPSKPVVWGWSGGHAMALLLYVWGLMAFVAGELAFFREEPEPDDADKQTIQIVCPYVTKRRAVQVDAPAPPSGGLPAAP